MKTRTNRINEWIETALETLGLASLPPVDASSSPFPDNAPLNLRIEHTLLKPDAGEKDIKTLCAEARELETRSVCIAPKDVSRAAENLASSNVMVVSVAGFPLGSGLKETKAYEASRAVEQGADEIDMVAAVDMLKTGELSCIRDEVAEVVNAAGVPVKVILETGYLSESLIVMGAVACVAGGAAFVKTSTGFGPRGASVEDVHLLRAAVGPGIGIKAAGGIKTRREAMAMIEAGADLIGSSSSAAILA